MLTLHLSPLYIYIYQENPYSRARLYFSKVLKVLSCMVAGVMYEHLELRYCFAI